MFYKYYIYLGVFWKSGRVNADSVEKAATTLKNVFPAEKDTTIVLWEDCEEFD